MALAHAVRGSTPVAAANLAHLLVPEIIVLGGGISRVGEPFRSAVEQAVVAHGPQGLPKPIALRLAALGDAAPASAASPRAHAMGAPEGAPAE